MFYDGCVVDGLLHALSLVSLTCFKGLMRALLCLRLKPYNLFFTSTPAEYLNLSKSKELSSLKRIEQ
jgi:hypothetical protein